MLNEIVEFFQAQCRSLNLKLVPSKSQLWWPLGELDADVLPQVTRRNQGGITVCKVPVGTPEFVRAHISEKLAGTYDSLLDKVKLMADVQVQFLILKFCINSNYTYWMRCLPPEEMQAALEAHDLKCLHVFAEGVLDSTVDALSHAQGCQIRLQAKRSRGHRACTASHRFICRLPWILGKRQGRGAVCAAAH